MCFSNKNLVEELFHQIDPKTDFYPKYELLRTGASERSVIPHNQFIHYLLVETTEAQRRLLTLWTLELLRHNFYKGSCTVNRLPFPLHFELNTSVMIAHVSQLPTVQILRFGESDQNSLDEAIKNTGLVCWSNTNAGILNLEHGIISL